MNTPDPSRLAQADNGRLHRVRLLLVLAVLSVPTAAARGAVAAAKATLLDDRAVLCHFAAAGRVLTAPAE
ncbi:MAG TPA: hypothetical protein VFG68_13090 [Fimbriiglobus sp.]|nr:hypothetical protein [Fimbriiglobus sp.]